MPTNVPSTLPEWSEENLDSVLANIFREMESDDALRSQLMADPFGALCTRIQVPEEYRGGIFAKDKNRKGLMIYIPERGAERQALPAGTAEAETQPTFQVLCTSDPVW